MDTKPRENINLSFYDRLISLGWTVLAVDGQSTNVRGGLTKSNLGGTAADKTREDLSTSVLPLGELLAEDSVDVLESVEALEKAGSGNVSWADVECPRDEGAVLVLVQVDTVDGLQGDGLLRGL